MVTLVVGAAGAFLAYAVGGLVGFASSLLFLPVLLLLGVPLPEAVALNLVLAIVTRLPSVVALRADVDVRRTAVLVAGSVPGIALGVVTTRVVPQHALEVAAGVLVLASGLYLLAAREVPADHPGVSVPATALTGACSGLMGITTSLNGIPPAVLLARSGATVRTRLADLSVFFAVGNCLTLAALAVTGSAFVLPVTATTAGWLLAGLVGNAVGLALAGRLDARRFDLLTIGLVLLSGVGALVGAAF
ncbi:sulfite exporter TauE/SafE family protein [Pimelobacter sp. 30-1]|uniref:sulfite exporter TauE/SafE family protein n=1 Tax=Pimelobacter sp. 30-1 TaxID=2004991 RepID=UPI001C05D0B8|nr:sulfite exporter TauE/SafE family protein [Pimelobacter sp. 30-1]